jgi:hypothetical protein
MNNESTYTMSKEEKSKIRELLFHRNPEAPVRTKIFQLAATLGNVENGGDDDYWACIYHYGLPENRNDLNADHKEFYNPAEFFDSDEPEKKKKKT